MVTTWWKNGKLLYESAFLRTENNNLIIQNTTSGDTGIYECKTVQVYEYGKREQTVNFYVEVNGKYFFTIIKYILLWYAIGFIFKDNFPVLITTKFII